MSRHLLRYCATALVGTAFLMAACQPRETPRQPSPGEPQASAPSAQGRSAPAAPARQAGKSGGTLTFAIAKDITHLNPLVRTSSTDRAVRELMFESFLDLDERGNIVPKLADRWEVSPDGKVYTFHLRQGVKFHNGQEMTAEDALFAIEYTLEPKNAAHGLEKLRLVERAEAADPYTVRIYLKQPSASFLALLTDIEAFSVVPRGSVDEAVAKPTAFPPGTGPLKFVEWQPLQRLVLERNDDYYGEKAFVDRLVLRPIEDSTVRITALRAGDVDMAERTPYEWVKEAKDGKLPGIGYAEAVASGYREIVFNVAGPPFNNKKLRQAVAHAVDKREVLHAAYFGFGEPNDQAYPKGQAWYIEGVPSPTYDLDKARTLLQEAGCNGQEISIVIRQGGEEQALAATLQAQLKKVGINLRIEPLEYGAFVDRHRKGQFGMTISGGSADVDPVLTYTGDLVCEKDLTRRAQNAAGYCDEQMDALLMRMETERDPATRREVVKQMLTKFSDDVPMLPLGFVPRYFTFRDQVKGFVANPDGRFMSLPQTWLDK
jgi:peptide/nickel transport system substrate-binding protein